MTTATIEKAKELREGTTIGLAVEYPGETIVAYPPPFGVDESVYAGHEAESLSVSTPADVSAPSGRDGFPSSILRRLGAFYDWLNGPPMPERDRLNVRLIRARDEMHWSG